MESGAQWAELIWRSQIGTVLLYGAFAIHLSLAFWAIYIRRHLRMGWIEAVRLSLGLLIPVLIVQHAVGIRLAWTLYDTHRIYRSTLFNQWLDRKSTRLNSSHRCISYAVFCLKKKKK